MGAKSGNAMKLNDQALEVATFLVNKFIQDADQTIQRMERNFRKLEEAGVENLTGGRGDEIKRALDTAKKGFKSVVSATSKISKFLDTTLGKVIEGLKDRDDIAATANKLVAQTEKTKMQKA